MEILTTVVETDEIAGRDATLTWQYDKDNKKRKAYYFALYVGGNIFSWPWNVDLEHIDFGR